MKGRVVVVLCLIAAALMFPASASAGAETFQFQGESAYAYFTNTAGCLATSAFVIVKEQRTKDGPGQPETTSSVELFLHQHNHCSGELDLVDAYSLATLSADAFQVKGNVDFATLNATVTVYDETLHTELPVDISLTWTGAGELERERHKFHITEGACKYQSHAKGDVRPALATGTIIMEGTNFASGAAQDVSLGVVKSGSVAISCP
jgi:hypothetical protein